MKKTRNYKKLTIETNKLEVANLPTDDQYASAAEATNESITPDTLYSRTLLKGENKNDVEGRRFVEKYQYKDNEVLRFGIDPSKVSRNNLENEDKYLGHEGLICTTEIKSVSQPFQAASKSQTSQGTAKPEEKYNHYSLEHESLRDAIKYLIETSNRTALVDTLKRNGEQIVVDGDLSTSQPEIHSVLLYKNPANKDGKHSIIVIDPNNVTFSSHLSKLTQTEGERLKEDVTKLDNIYTPSGKLQIYTPKAKKNPQTNKEEVNTGPNADQSRDCIDIAVKLAFGFNKEKNDFSVGQLENDKLKLTVADFKTLDVVKQISNEIKIDNTIINQKLISRIKQASNNEIVKIFYELEKSLKMALDASTTFIGLTKYQEYLSKYTEALSENNYTEAIKKLLELNKTFNNDIGIKLSTKHAELSKKAEAIVGKGTANISENNSNYWYEYSKVAMEQLLELRLISADMESEVNIIHPNLVFSEENKLSFSQDLATQIASIADISPGSKILIPINIDNQHWVGMSMEFTVDDKILINYMDSEGTRIPRSLEAGLLQELSYVFSTLAVEINTEEVEQQKYNNCGLEVIENLISAVAGEAARLSQEDALAVHSALFEDNLVNEFISKEAKSEQKTMKIAWKEVQNQQIIERAEEILLEETNSDYISTASKFQHQHPVPVLGGIETVKNLLETLLRFISGEPLPGGKSITDGITTMQSVPDISVPTPIIAETNPIFEDFT